MLPRPYRSCTMELLRLNLSGWYAPAWLATSARSSSTGKGSPWRPPLGKTWSRSAKFPTFQLEDELLLDGGERCYGRAHLCQAPEDA